MKLAVMTGGSRGLGKELFDLLVGRGWAVFEISRSGGSVKHLRADLGDGGAIEEVLSKVVDEVGDRELDEVLFLSNAGTVEPIRRVGGASPEEILRSLHANAIAPIRLVNAFVAAFDGRAERRTVLHVSSGAARRGHAGWGLYGAGKAAVEGYLRTLAEEDKAKDGRVRTIVLDPFVMDTAMQEAIRASDPAEFPQRDRFRSFREKGVLLPPREVARAAMRLVDDFSLRDPFYDVKQLLADSPD